MRLNHREETSVDKSVADRSDEDFIQCDGRQPCFRCQKAAAGCLYQKRQRGHITDLLAEIERLRKDNAEKDKLLEIIMFSHNVETCKNIIQNLKNGNKSRQDVSAAMHSKIRCHSFQVGNQEESCCYRSG